jgi:Leucine-rich repeat (LRR) protein
MRKMLSMLHMLMVAVVVYGVHPGEVQATGAPTSGDISGSFTVTGSNSPTQISNMRITDLSGVEIASGLSNEALTRLNQYLIEFEISDLDGLDHVDVYVALYNTNSSVKETTSSGLIDAITSGVTTQSLVMRWLSPERSTYLETLDSGVFTAGATEVLVRIDESIDIVASPPAGIAGTLSPTNFNDLTNFSWIVPTDIPVGATELQSGISYRVTIPFQLSKVAPSSGVWNLGVQVFDRLQKEIDEPRTDQIFISTHLSTNDYGNSWYGEVSVVGSGTVTFPNVQAESGFQLAIQSGTSAVEVRFVANGPFQQEFLTDSTWANSSGVLAYLIADSGLNAITNELNRFALQVRRNELSGVIDVTSFVDLIPKSSGLVPLVTDNAYFQQGDSTPIESQKAVVAAIMSATPEAGITSRFEFQLRASNFLPSTGGTYNGNISVNISNVSPIGNDG